MVKCYFIFCGNDNCEVEVSTGLGPSGPVFNPVCPDCIKKTRWVHYEERPLVTKQQEDLITSAQGTLWGTAGGQLELMSINFITRKVDGRWQKFAILRFTDHDLQAVSEDGLRDAGLNPWYELTFPITDGY